MIEVINPIIRGWGNYYRKANVRKLFRLQAGQPCQSAQPLRRAARKEAGATMSETCRWLRGTPTSATSENENAAEIGREIEFLTFFFCSRAILANFWTGSLGGSHKVLDIMSAAQRRMML